MSTLIVRRESYYEGGTSSNKLFDEDLRKDSELIRVFIGAIRIFIFNGLSKVVAKIIKTTGSHSESTVPTVLRYKTFKKI